MKTRYINGELEIKNFPAGIWIIGGFFSIVGIILSLLLNVINDNWIITAFLVCSIILALGGLWMVFSYRIITTKINRNEKIVTVVKRSFFKETLSEYKFVDISKFGVVGGKCFNGEVFYYPVLERIREENIRLSDADYYDDKNLSKVCGEANEFLKFGILSAK